MKTKRLLMCVLIVICLLFGCLALSACSLVYPSNGVDNDIMQIYREYVDFSTENGETTLSYEDWLASIKGEKGEDGLSAYEIWLNAGNSGTEEDFLNWLKGVNDHNFGEWIVFAGEGLDCSERIYYHVCLDCNKIEWIQGDNSFHSWQVTTIAPSCTEQGYDISTCTVCGTTKKTNFITVSDHIAGKDGKCTICGFFVADTEGVVYCLSEGKTYAAVLDYTGTATEVIIAESYEGVPVTQIYEKAFYNNDNITEVIIPDSVTSIGESAFAFCGDLTSVEIPNSVTSIGESAFAFCFELTSVDIPDSVTTIGRYAFYNCSSLTSVEIPNSVTSMGAGVFGICSSLTSVEIPNSVTSIGTSTFYCCYNLTSVVIPDSVTTIGDYAFYECSSLTSVVIPDSVTTIGDWAFSYCCSLISVYYNGTVEEWANILIAISNFCLTNATIYYYSESQPTEEGNYWHYDENGNPVVW